MYDVCVHKNYRLLTVGKIIKMDRHISYFLCYLATTNGKYNNNDTKDNNNTIITAKCESSWYFGQISGEKHVLNFGKELILQFMEVF